MTPNSTNTDWEKEFDLLEATSSDSDYEKEETWKLKDEVYKSFIRHLLLTERKKWEKKNERK